MRAPLCPAAENRSQATAPSKKRTTRPTPESLSSAKISAMRGLCIHSIHIFMCTVCADDVLCTCVHRGARIIISSTSTTTTSKTRCLASCIALARRTRARTQKICSFIKAAPLFCTHTDIHTGARTHSVILCSHVPLIH